MNGHVKLNTGIFFGSVLMLCSKIEQILSTILKDTDHQSWLVFETPCVNVIMYYCAVYRDTMLRSSWVRRSRL